MHNKNRLLNQIKLTPQQHRDCLKIQRVVEQRFFQWLITKNLSEHEDLTDGLFDAGISDEIALDKSSRKENQRLLLEVEKAGELARAAKREEIMQRQELASRLLTKNMRSHMVKKLSDPKHIMNNLLRLPPSMSDLISVLHSPSANYQRVASMINAVNGMPKQLIDLVNNVEFCRNIGREPRAIKDVSAAVGFVGIEGLKLVLPIMAIKSRLRFHCDYYPMLGPKLWSYITTSANTTRCLLKDAGHDNGKELDGVLLGALSVMGMMAIHHQLPQSFEEVRIRCLEALREQNNRVLYNAMVDAKPNLSLLPELFIELADDVSQRIADNIEWDRLRHVKGALDEQYRDVHPQERSLHGVAVGQAVTFSQFELLRRAKRFTSKEHIRPFLYGSSLSQEAASNLLKHDLRKLDLREYIG